MSKADLRNDLETLREEVNQLAGSNPEAQQRLNRLISDLETRIAADPTEAEHDNLIENIREEISNFETEHPRATAILNDIMVTLSNMGI